MILKMNLSVEQTDRRIGMSKFWDLGIFSLNFNSKYLSKNSTKMLKEQ